MTHEQFVSLETARLLKQAGFDWECNHRYSEGHSINDSEPIYISPRDNWNQDKGRYSAPTQAVAQRWIREVKGIVVLVLYNSQIKEWVVQYTIDKKQFLKDDDGFTKHFPTYEAALEAGLQKCLTLLIEKQKQSAMNG